MHPLLLRLASLRRRLFLVNGWLGLTALAALLIGAAVLIGMVDYTVHLPGLVRALALLGILGGAGFIAYRFLVLPFRAPSDDLSLALRVEAQFPQLNDALGSAVQFLEIEDNPNAPGSALMRKKAIEQTEKMAEDCSFAEVIPASTNWIMLGLTAASLLFFVALYVAYFAQPRLTSTALARLFDPFGNHPWTQIGVDGCPHKVAVGKPYAVKAHFDGIIPVQAVVEIEALGVITRKPAAIKVNADGKSSIHEPQDMTRHRGEFKFRILANDGVYPPGRDAWHKVEVLPPPRLTLLNDLPSPQIELHFPGYTELASPAKLAPGALNIDAPAGTRVVLRAAADRALAEAWIEFRPEQNLVRLSALMTPFTTTGSWDVLGGLVGGNAIWGRFPAVFSDEEKTIFSIDFVPQVNGYYILHLEDADGLDMERTANLRVQPDPVPVVKLLRPGSTMSVLPDADISFQVVVEDEHYAVRSVYVEYRVRDLEGKWVRVRDLEGKLLDDGPQRLDMFDHQLTGRLLPQLGAMVAKSPLIGPPVRLRPKSLELNGRWPLRSRFEVGKIIVLQICAEDFCDLYPLSRQAGRSHEVEIRIVGNQELAKILDDGLADAQKELVRVQKMQEEAIDLAKEIQKNQDKAGPKELDQLIEAEQLQKQILERIGKTSDEGLRKELAKLNQLIKDNKLPPSEVQDHIKTLKQELERLSEEDLQQIEPNLAETRKDLIAPKEDPKNDPKANPKGDPKQNPKNDKTALDKAVNLQQDVKKSLDELSKFLDPWASMQQVKGKTRDLMTKQKDLQKDTELAKNKQDQLKEDNPNFDKVQEEIKKDLGKIGESQNNLGQKAQELMDMIAKAQAKRVEQKDEDAAAKLKAAGKIAKDNKLPDKLREVAKNLNEPDPHIHTAKDNQRDNIKILEKMLAALEESKKDDHERLKKKQKKADEVQDKLDKIAQAQERLQKKVKDANKIEDPAARQQELKRLAEEQNQLKEEAKKNARELSQLNEERASQDLNRAAQEMDKAAEKMAAGENPEENQQEALDRLEEAQAKLADFQEELAREQLAKIADRLEGLKERQDAALERSKGLHKKVVGKNRWSKGLLETLGGDQISQEGLAKEADSLREKIKDAKVFEHILGKAAKAMQDAAKVMDGRREEAKNRQAGDLDKKDLADEIQKDEDTRKLQNQASQRLQRLLDALKNEPPQIARKPKKKDNDPKAGGKEPDEPKNGIRPGDGIPPMAELKALRAEQLDVNERTKDFAQKNLDANNLNDAQRAELAVIQADQEKIRQLFGDMTAQNEKKGEQP